MDEIGGEGMENVLYEVSFSWNIFYTVEVVLIIAFILKVKCTEINLSTLVLFCALVLVTLPTALSIYESIVIINAYELGDYSIIEGEVENFIPMPYEGHANEKFDINGVVFEYSNNLVVTGYNKTKYHGGVITKNGQRLKIGYVKYDKYNRIVYIEQLE